MNSAGLYLLLLVAKENEMDIWCDFRSNQEKKEANGKDKNRYQELKAEVQRKLRVRVDKQQQLEGMCVELEAASLEGNSR